MQAAGDKKICQQECSNDTSEITAELKRQRIRTYQVRYEVPNCPFNILLLVNWLVIENATVEDASNIYECYAEYSVSNPTANVIISQNSLHVNPGKISPMLEPVKKSLSLNSIFFPYLSLPTNRSGYFGYTWDKLNLRPRDGGISPPVELLSACWCGGQAGMDTWWLQSCKHHFIYRGTCL